jgi:hypothetical protein
MSVGRDYTLNVSATIKDYEKKLGEIPGVTQKESRKAALALHNELLKGQRLANAAAKKAAQEAANNWKKAGEEALQAAGDASKAKGAIGLFSATGSEAAGVLNDIVDAGEGLSGFAASLPGLMNPAGAAIAGVTLAVAGGLAYWKLSNKEHETAQRRVRETKAAHQELRPVLDGIAEAELRIAVATGRMTEAQAAEARVRREASALMRSSTAGVQEKQAELREELSSVTVALVDQAREVSAMTGPFGALTRGVLAFARGSEEVSSDLAFQNTLLVEGANKVEQWTDAQIVANREEGKAADAKGKSTKASEKLTAAEREEARVAAELAKARAAQQAANEFGGRLKAIEDSERRAAAIVAGATKREGDAFAKLEEEKKAKLAEYMEAAKAAAYDRAQIAADTTAIELSYERQAAEERLRLAKAEEEKRSGFRNQQVGAYGDMFGSISDIAATFSEKMAGKDKKAALEAWKVSQAAALAQAGVNTALAVSNALAQPVPPPVSAALAIAAGLAGAAQVAAIASADPPQLAHRGETYVQSDRPGPMEVDRRVRPGEAIVPMQGADMLGRDRIERARRGMDPYADLRGGGANFTTYGHRAFARFSRDMVRLSNPVRAAITSGSSIGLRTRK